MKEKFSILRYPPTNNRSLRAWNAADELLLEEALNVEDSNSLEGKLGLVMDRFGFLSVKLSTLKPTALVTTKSQEKSIRLNAKKNGVDLPKFSNPLEGFGTEMQLVLMQVPKSLDLYHLFLSKIAQCIEPGGRVCCGFMTKHFTPKLLEIGARYFERVWQGKAHKKARVLYLEAPKKALITENLTRSVELDNGAQLTQYFGVFSAGRVDLATRFLLDNLPLDSLLGSSKVLDLASGNGVLAHAVQDLNIQTEIHLVDDAWLAVESAKLNVNGERVKHHWEDELDHFPTGMFDVVLCNPPFHFEHENNIEVALRLFQEVRRCLSASGCFQLVANRHLNYRIHLSSLFSSVETVRENDRFIIYCCRP